MYRLSNRLGRAVAACCAMVLFASVLAACEPGEIEDSGASSSVIASPNDSRAYRLITLENGIEVMLVSDPAAEKSAAA